MAEEQDLGAKPEPIQFISLTETGNACGKTCVSGICGLDPDPDSPC